MGYEYRYYEKSRIWRRLAVGTVLAVAGAGAYVGIAELETQAEQELMIDTTSPGSSSPATSAPSTTTTSTPATSAATTTTTTTTTTSTTSTTSTSSTTLPAPPNTLPDGSSVPVVAIFDTDTITLAGAVPSQAAADRLTMLAQANSKTPAAVIDLLTIDATVPIGVGVRVIELTSSRFPAGEATITLRHGAELLRMVAVMNALPTVSVLVVGHADQIGSDTTNMELSEDRAQAVVEFMVDQGIAPARLSARAVGESDLLSLADDEAALALNRRTEFVVYGALLDA
jgi:outer membrane protein OmpA-like peptidoglycan-associated protein